MDIKEIAAEVKKLTGIAEEIVDIELAEKAIRYGLVDIDNEQNIVTKKG